ncbi:sulfotransferase family protein [Verrucomicrobium sp. 3C]|uniref:sulfotransferase family protein n=1 Tax=Verrucomicrobium sp. 3C TaxID=1134055 RepID=UPI0003812987|nr:sulfotransferase [Verrucomicrobium sp. 3C]
MKSHAVLVLGMHRCGTSALTRCLGFLGVELGSEFIEPAEDNPTGFWEDSKFLVINRRLNQLLGEERDRFWEHSAPLEIPASSPEVRSLMSEAIESIRGRFAACPWWAFKDPRTLRALPFWEEALVQAGIKIIEVIAVRHPLACAESLLRRDDIPEDRSLLLWASHYLAHWPRVAARPFVAVDYDRLLEEPERELRRLSDRLGLPWRETAVEEAGRFLRADLQHTRFAAEDLQDRPDISPLVVETFQALNDLCADHEPKVASSRMRSLHAEFRRMVPLLRVMDAEWLSTKLVFMAELQECRAILATRSRELAALRTQIGASRTYRLLLRLRTLERSFRGLRKRLLGSRSHESQ